MDETSVGETGAIGRGDARSRVRAAGHGRAVRMSRAELGRWGEDVAAEYLGSLGWVILERNWRAVRSVAGVAGELDIIAVDGETLVVVEVKTRAGGLYDDPAEAVTRAKLAKMRSLTRAWLSGSERYWPTVRFDVVSVHRDDIDDRRIRHLRGVF